MIAFKTQEIKIFEYPQHLRALLSTWSVVPSHSLQFISSGELRGIIVSSRSDNNHNDSNYNDNNEGLLISMISQNFLVLTLYSWDHTDHPTVRHDTWNGQIKGYRVLHVPFPLDYFPHTSPRPAPSRAAQLNTVIGDIRRSFDKVSPTYVDMMTDHTLHCCSGTTTALNSLQPFTNYSIQVTFWDESTIRCVYIVCDSWAGQGRGATF